jgi:Fe-S cluster biosynthesis and repair protein YggX
MNDKMDVNTMTAENKETKRKMFFATNEDYVMWLRQQIALINEGKLVELDPMPTS